MNAPETGITENDDAPRRVITHLREYKLATITVGAFSGLVDAATFVLVAAAGVAATGGTRPLLPGGFNPSVKQALGLAVGTTLLRFSLSFGYTRLVSRWSANTGAEVKLGIAQLYLGAQWPVQELTSEADLQQAVVQDVEQVSSWLQTYLSFVSVLAGAVVSLATAAVVSPLGAAVAVAMAPVVLLVLRPTAARARRTAQEYARESKDSGQRLASLSKLTREIRMTDQAGVGEYVVDAVREPAILWRRSRFYSAMHGQIAQTMATLLIVGGILVATALSPRSAGSFAAAALISLRASTYLQGAQAQYATLRALAPYLERVAARMSMLNAAQERLDGAALDQLRTLDLVNVRPLYGNIAHSGDPVSISLRAGESCALFGASGAGKTTLLWTLAGLLQPKEGAVLVNGVPMSEVSLHSYWQRTGIVTQEFAVFPGTVSQNISFFAGRDSERLTALVVQLFPEFRGDSEGFLSADASRLSGGQRQRLALARAIFMRKDILFLDEPTSGLDRELEDTVLSLLKEHCQGGGMFVLITHRRWIAECCTMIVEL